MATASRDESVGFADTGQSPMNQQSDANVITASHSEPPMSQFSQVRLDTTSTIPMRTGARRSRVYTTLPPLRIDSIVMENGGSTRINIDQESDGVLRDPYEKRFYRTDSEFRSALQYADPDQREKEREAMEKKERLRRREVRLDSEPWNVRRWFSGLEDTASPKHEHHDPMPPMQSPPPTAFSSPRATASHHDTPSQSPTSPTGHRKWSLLKSLIPQIIPRGERLPTPSAVVGSAVKITDEVTAGALPALLLRMWFERDERGGRRVPVLLHRLKIRISDSLHPLHGTRAVFRIECEYADGVARWVIYPQLRDFLTLHAKYRVYGRNVSTLPEFPRTSLPYFKILKKQNREKGRDEFGRPEFARLQREALENYLVGLVRAVMFHPASNRLSRFLEISALSIHLARSGGSQLKAGLLKIKLGSGPKSTFARKSLGRGDRKKFMWCVVRESYLVILKDPAELEATDVFLLDSDFTLDRPTRVYRKGTIFMHDHRDNTGYNNAERTSVVIGGKGSTMRFLQKFLCTKSSGSEPAPSNDHAPSEPQFSPIPSEDNTDEGDGLPSPPMIDPSTNMDPLRSASQDDFQDPHSQDNTTTKKPRKDVSQHTFFIENSQMRLKLFAKDSRQMHQWITAFGRVAAASHWTGKHRFDSFAPIRLNVAAQWLVDGRDYFWNLSRAILLAKETIYIHSWWISPELYMRRPGQPLYRLDRLLERKAREGVKIFIIIYKEVSSLTTPTDSNYTKQRLIGLHENIMVQRSPSHFQTGTFYWAHHEKMCIIDGAIAFMGGLDLCFGRWDTTQHALVDDGQIHGREGSDFIWPGKDYSNERVSEFHTLNKPDDDMYDRAKVPRMPWHDVALQIVGQPARDLCRHFVQRWNHLLRTKNHSREMPFLLPPPEFKPHELAEHGLVGTCEVQICRSAGLWSLGTPSKVEHSVQNAYLRAIQTSEHFIYIENQFFITSTTVNDVQIENQIGDALVHRIIRAHREGTKWRAIILIPLLPGFPARVEQGEASALRIILDCQNRSISRGPNSIFSRLRNEGIDPDEYITFFSLRGWGKLKGDVLTTEQVYIHAKILIVDDRVAIIGSANINERSQRGDRDSEVVSVIRDTDMINSKMDGKPYKVGRFAHTLRVRLMREHLGIDDCATYDNCRPSEPVTSEMEQKTRGRVDEQERDSTKRKNTAGEGSSQGTGAKNLQDVVAQAIHGKEDATGKDLGRTMQDDDIKAEGPDPVAGDAASEEKQGYDHERNERPQFALAPTLEEKTVAEHQSQSNGSAISDVVDGIPEERVADGRTQAGERNNVGTRIANDSEVTLGTPADSSKKPQVDDQARQGKDTGSDEEMAAGTGRPVDLKPWALPVPTPKIDPYGFEDPICDEFFKNTWLACALHNTDIYRKVFHAIPDDLVTTWKQYKEFIVHHERIQKPAKRPDPSQHPIARMPSETGNKDTQYRFSDIDENIRELTDARNESPMPYPSNFSKRSSDPQKNNRRVSRPDEPLEQWEREQMEALLMEVRGHLVMHPTRFLEGEDVANNFLYSADRLLPLAIYV